MTTLVRAIVGAVVLAACPEVASQALPQLSQRPVFHDGALSVSLIELISRPNDFSGKRVIVKGVANIEFEGTALYLHSEDRVYTNYPNALWLSLSRDSPLYKPSLTGKYVVVVGEFNAGWRGHNGVYSGTITNIQELTRLHQRR